MSSAPSDPALPVHAKPLRQRLNCPRCACSVRRRRRTGLQRWLFRDTALALYRCVDAACGWSGLLTRRLEPEVPARGAWSVRALRGVVPLLLAGLAVLGAQWGAAHAPAADVRVGARLFAPGEAFDGDALPEEHPLLVPAGLALAAPAGAAALSPRVAGLAVRRFCAWGRPGRMPYRGTVDEALRAAQLPPFVREQLGAAIAAGRPHDRLTIANDAIRAISSTRTFEPRGFAMTYDRTLCLGTRVNFKPGHVEPASLYEAFDASGRRYSVMVPDICGNVSVLKASSERRFETVVAPGSRLDGADPLDPGPPDHRALHAALSGKPNEVPTPGTLVLSLFALAAAAVVRGRARKRLNGPQDARRGPP